MPQISLYIDENTLRKIEGASARQHVSISKWVAEQIRAKLAPTYPIGFERLFGSLREEYLRRPAQRGRSHDSARESF